MSFGTTGDFIVLSGLATRVHIAYKDAPDYYRHISEEVATLKLLIDKVVLHFKSTSSNDRHGGQAVLKGCQGVLEDLNSFIERYKRIASMNKRLVLNGVRLGKDITALQVQLISNTALLKGFVRRCVVHFMNPMDINTGISV